MTDQTKILVGKIVAAQGLRGEVRVQTYTASPNDFKNLTVFGNGIEPADFSFVRLLNPSSAVIIAKIRGFDDRTAAETLRGTDLYVSRDTLPATKSGEYYQADLIGFTVVRGTEILGTVDCFQNFGAGDILQLNNGEMVSFGGADVNMNDKKIYIK